MEFVFNIDRIHRKYNAMSAETLVCSFCSYNGHIVDDTVILSINIDPAIATFILQKHLNHIQEWTKIWKIKINETKSTQVNFSLRREQCPEVFLNDIQIPTSPRTKYLCIYLNNHLTWKEHIKNVNR
jgi:hypothetical protein